MITTVTIAGQVQDPCQVEATSVVVTHGRQSFADRPTTATASLVLLHPPGSMPPWATGDLLTLTGPQGAAFTGRITDRRLTHPAPGGGRGRFTITATGTLARLGVRKVGDTPWPQETGSARAARILTAAAVPHQVQGAVDDHVLPRDVDSKPALTLLEDLTRDTQAAVFDTPDGAVVYQAMSHRQRTVFPWRWTDFDPGTRWADFDPALTWDGLPPSIGQWKSPASTFPLRLLPQTIEWEQEWVSSEGEVLNRVRVGWGAAEAGSDQAWVEVSDDASIARHGERYTYLGTQLATEAGGLGRASYVVATQARDRWSLRQVVILLDRVLAADPDTYARCLRLRCGDQVTVPRLPQPAPAEQWTGIVEGWSLQQWRTPRGDMHERITLYLSDLLHSLVVMRWDEFPAVFRWADFPAWVSWDDLTDPDRLGWPASPQKETAA